MTMRPLLFGLPNFMYRSLVYYLSVVSLIYSSRGNLCRCHCGSHENNLLTVVIPSAQGCKQCIASLCKEKFFTECVNASNVIVECINRSAWFSVLVVVSFCVILIGFVGCGILMRFFPHLRDSLKVNDNYFHEPIQNNLSQAACSYISDQCTDGVSDPLVPMKTYIKHPVYHSS